MVYKLIALIGIGLLLALWFIKAPVISSYLTDKLGLEVSIRGISIWPRETSITQFKIANPSGYRARNALDIEKTQIHYSWRKLFQNPSVIDLIVLENVALNIEIRKGGTSDNNWADIGSYMPERKNEREMLIRKVIVKNLTVTTEGVGANTLGVAGVKHFDQMEFTEINSKEGFPTKELINQIFQGAGLRIFIQKFLNPTQQIQKALNPFKLFGGNQSEQKKAPEMDLEGSAPL